MTTNKTRLHKLESVKPGQVTTDNRLFTQEVRTEGNHKYFIDGVQVDEAKYQKELAVYLRIQKDNNIPVEIVVNLSGGDE